jgi:hypothetical protein
MDGNDAEGLRRTNSMMRERGPATPLAHAPSAFIRNTSSMGSGRQHALVAMRLRVAVVAPEVIDELREHATRSMTMKPFGIAHEPSVARCKAGRVREFLHASGRACCVQCGYDEHNHDGR